MESERGFLKLRRGKRKVSARSGLQLRGEAATVLNAQGSTGSGGTSHDHRVEAEVVDHETGRGKSSATDEWSRNFTEGVNKMIGNSASHLGPIYLKEGNSKGKRTLQEIYPPNDIKRGELIQQRHNSLGKSPVISDLPKVSDAEIELTFCAVWNQAKDCVEALSNFIVSGLHNIIDKNSIVDSLHPDTYFIEPQHKDYVITAQLYEVFLRHFESEGFGTGISDVAASTGKSEVPQFGPPPSVRAARFYQYFKAGSMHTDLDYIDWFRDRVKLFCDVFRVNMGWITSFPSVVDAESLLQTLGGPYLASYFKAATVACWNLQTLGFSFQEPATRLNVEDGDEFDDSCMEPVVDVEKDEFTGDRGELMVSFMVTPGFYFGDSLIPAEVYLIAVSPELSESTP